MSDDPLDLSATPARVRVATGAAGLSGRALERAIEIALATPGSREWRSFLSRALAMFGAALLLAGVGSFVAFNWTRIGRFGKFALIEAAIVAAAVAGWWKLPRLSGQLALAAAAVLVGPLFAVFGQTYQTGADPYGLFLTWFVVTLPWVIVASFSPLWVFALALVDVALVLFWIQVVGVNDLGEALRMPLLIAAIHGSATLLWEWQFTRRAPSLDEPWASRTVVATGFFALWIAASAGITSEREAGIEGVIGVAALAAGIAAAFHFYRRVRRDRFMLTVAVATGMAFVTVGVARVLFDTLDLELLGFFVMAGVVIMEITVGVGWFRRSRPDSATEP